MSVRLKVLEGKPQGATIALHGKWFYIGRDPSCQLRPKHEDVDPKHCALFLQGDYVEVKDLGSEGGTLLNGRRLKPSISTPAHNGDRLQVGPLVFEVQVGADMPGDHHNGQTPPPSEDLLEDEEEASSTARIANRLIQRQLGQGPDPMKAVGTHLHAVISEGVPCVTIDISRITEEMVPVFKRELANLAERPALTRVVLDFRKVREIGLEAADILLAFNKKLQSRGARLKICELTPETMEVLAARGVMDEIPVFLDCHDAIWSAW
jgi:pSer/pThr/pTyr-binding forkhead associated (FHA) protein